MHFFLIALFVAKQCFASEKKKKKYDASHAKHASQQMKNMKKALCLMNGDGDGDGDGHGP